MFSRKPAVKIVADYDGDVHIEVSDASRHKTMTSLSQAVCGAFDIAGEHDKEVMEAMTSFVKKSMKEEKDGVVPFPGLWQ